MAASKWMIIEKNERHGAVFGTVVDGFSEQSMSGVSVVISAMPAAFAKWLSLRAVSYGDRWTNLVERPDRTMTSAKGTFGFVDLPDGDYQITFYLASGEQRYGTVQKNFTVSRGVDGRINTTALRVELPPTGLRGRVLGTKDSDTVPLVMAKVRLSGKDEPVYTDGEGKFVLTGVFPGQDRLSITARGYVPAVSTPMLIRGSILELADFVLAPESL